MSLSKQNNHQESIPKKRYHDPISLKSQILPFLPSEAVNTLWRMAQKINPDDSEPVFYNLLRKVLKKLHPAERYGIVQLQECPFPEKLIQAVNDLKREI